MGILCLFRLCKWEFAFNVDNKSSAYGHQGVWQCCRCKTISVGQEQGRATAKLR